MELIRTNRAMVEPSSEYIARVSAGAAAAFADHVLTTDDGDDPTGSTWRCARPDTLIHWFSVRFEPGMVCIWGDLGECVIRVNAHDSLGWFARAPSGIDYFMEKIRALDGAVDQFCYGDAIGVLDDMVATAECDRDDAGALTSWGRATIGSVAHIRAEMMLVEHLTAEEQGQRWWDLMIESGDDDPCLCRAPTQEVVWLWAARAAFRRLFAAWEVEHGARRAAERELTKPWWRRWLGL